MRKRKQWDLLKFETDETMIRAVRVRAGLEGVTQAEVINAALRGYLAREIVQASEQMAREGKEESGGTKRGSRAV
jgi:hypothetical protein